MVSLIILLAVHGLCYDFFFVTGLVDAVAQADEKFEACAQALIAHAAYGIGMLIGFWAAGLIADFYTIHGQQNREMIWIIPAVFAVVVMIIFFFVFDDQEAEKPVQEEEVVV